MARRLGITAQAVSVQVQELLDAELLVDADGLRPTPAGFQALQADAESLRAAADGLAGPLATNHVISAIASRDVEAGTTVGLWMREGDLLADPDDVGESRGITMDDAKASDEVRVRSPTGIARFQPGRIEVIRLPAPDEGRLPNIRIDDRSLVAAVGTRATVAARHAGRLDIPYAGAAGALNAAQRGIDVQLFVAGDQLSEALRAIEDGNKDRRVTITVRDAEQ